MIFSFFSFANIPPQTTYTYDDNGKTTTYHKQTPRQLANEYRRSIPWVRKQIFEYEPVFNTYNPREVLVVADATFFGKRRDKFGVLVFKDVWSGDILIWKYIESETIKDYMYLTNELKDKDFRVRGVVMAYLRHLMHFLYKCVTSTKR